MNSPLCSYESFFPPFQVGSVPLEGFLKRCFELFKEKLDFLVPPFVTLYQPFSLKLTNLAASHSEFAESENDKRAIEFVLQSLTEQESNYNIGAKATILDELEAEVTQEQEQEEEEEQVLGWLIGTIRDCVRLFGGLNVKLAMIAKLRGITVGRHDC